MHIVIMGLGEVGGHLLKVLDREEHDIVAIDRKPSKVRYAEEHFDVGTLCGYGPSQKVMRQANVANADLVVAVTDHDEANLIAALGAKQLGAKRVVARVQSTEWAEGMEGVQYGVLGVDVVINPRIVVAKELTKVALSHGASEVITLAQDRIELVQVDVTEETRNTGKPISQISMPKGVLVAGVVRAEQFFVPGGVDVLLAGDRVYLIGLPDSVLAMEDMFSSRREAKRVCIMGGGVVGESLARNLIDEGSRVLIIERNLARAEELSAKLEKATVVHGEGTDLELLKEEEVHTYDLFAAVTANDEVNLMGALLAKRVDVPRTACLVQQGDHLPIYRQLGIDVALSPRLVASDQILRYSREARVESVTVLASGQAEVLEITAGAGCRALDTPLSRLNLPRGSILAAIVRKGSEQVGQVLVPSGADEVSVGDLCIVVTTTEARPSVERLFKGRRT